MVKRSEFISYVRTLEGKAIDQDGAYYAQCVDLILHVYKKYWDHFVYGNAIDYKHNALPTTAFKRGTVAQMGIEPGDILVWYWGAGDIYGHIGICLSYANGVATSLEQNVDGTMVNGVYTGPGRIRVRGVSQVVAVIRPDFEPETPDEADQQGRTNEEETGGIDMYLVMHIVGDNDFNENALYLVDFANKTIKTLGHPDELKVANEIYAANHNGKDIPTRRWYAVAPWYRRMIAAFDLKKI